MANALSNLRKVGVSAIHDDLHGRSRRPAVGVGSKRRMTPEQQARQEIDRLLQSAGWHVCGVSDANIHAAPGVAIREFPLTSGHGYADYLLYVDGKAAGVIEAKKAGVPLIGVEHQSGRYVQGLPAALPAWRRPLPFAYESTGIETHFTSGLDPEPRRARLRLPPTGDAGRLAPGLPPHGDGLPSPAASHDAPPTEPSAAASAPCPSSSPSGATRSSGPPRSRPSATSRRASPPDKPRALIQMATGSGKTFTAISAIYRLIKFAGARRVLFLVDRGNLGRQAKKEFDQYVSPVNNYKFGEEYIVQHLTSNHARPDRPRLYLHDPAHVLDAQGARAAGGRGRAIDRRRGGPVQRVEPIDYNPAFPIETFDIIVTDEAHRSIYNLWRQVLEYFDAYLIGLTATPNKQTFGFFNQNLVISTATAGGRRRRERQLRRLPHQGPR